MNRPLRICFVVPWAYALFNPASGHAFGGSEVRAWMFGKGLANLGAQVSFVVFNHGQETEEQYGDITVHAHTFYKAVPASPRLTLSLATLRAVWARGLRSVREWADLLTTPSVPAADFRISGVRVRGYEPLDADIYCVFGVHELAAEVVAFCRKAGKPSVVFSGSTFHFSEANAGGGKNRDRYGNRYGLCRYAIDEADLVVTQTDEQAVLARERFGRETLTIYNPIDLHDRTTAQAGDAASRDIVLWVGKSDAVKRPGPMLELARRIPDHPVVMVLNRSDGAIYDEMLRTKPDNVTIHESLSFAETDALFARARVLVNTSAFEGFPNTFLQAGRHGTPVASLDADPDGFLARHGCGRFAQGDPGILARDVTTLLTDDGAWSAYSRTIRQRIESHHDLDANTLRLHKALVGVARDTRPQSG